MFAHLEALHGAGGNVLSQTFQSPWDCEGGGHADRSSLVTAAAHGTPMVVSPMLRN